MRSRPVFNKGSKKPLNSEQGPREPKSVAKVWQDFELCKFFNKKSEKNRVFFHFSPQTGDLRHFFDALRTTAEQPHLNTKTKQQHSHRNGTKEKQTRASKRAVIKQGSLT